MPTLKLASVGPGSIAPAERCAGWTRGIIKLHLAFVAMDDYAHCYAVLGVRRDSDWETLRAQYRRLIGDWHPDRFSADSVQQKVAEEQSKRITVAYQVLEQYRREHGHLPLTERVAVSAYGQRQDGNSRSGENGTDSQNRFEMGSTGASGSDPAKYGSGRWRRFAFGLSVLIGALYCARFYLDEAATPDSAPVGEQVPEVSVAPPAARTADRSGEQRGISTGATFGEVYAVQGIPTRTEGDTWHYGKSHIRFDRGKVVSWSENPDNPLRIARNQALQRQDRYFKIGSTKDEVRAIQGTPVTEAAAVWDYGPSRVYFENNRVAGWEESPMQPLHARRQVSLP